MSKGDTYTADRDGYWFFIRMLYSLQGSYGIFQIVLWRHTWWVKKKVWICVIYLMKVLYALNFTSCLFGESKLYLIEIRWLYASRGDDCRSSDSIPSLLLQYRWASGALQPQEFILDTSTNIKRCVISDSSCLLGCGTFRWEANDFRNFATIASLRRSVIVNLMNFYCDAEVFGQ